MKKVEIIIPHGMLVNAHNVLKELNVGGISYYSISGSGKVKADPVVSGTHPSQTPEYISRTKVEVVVKDEQVEELIVKVREALRVEPQGGKIFVVDVPVALDITTNKRGEEAI
jgi:nitrogen regulatory protein P-II 1